MIDFSRLVPAPTGRFDGIDRPYSPEEVAKLRGSVQIEHSLARRGANRLWELLTNGDYVNALGAVTGNQAMQMVRAGLRAIYLSGWQVAADANNAGAIRNLDAARLAADVCGVPTLVVARTDAESARLITSDVDERDREWLTGERTPEGFFRLREGIGVDHCIRRGLAFAPHADLLWWETSRPDLADARRFAEAIRREYPGKLMAYNCSPSFNWAAKLDAGTIARFQRELGAMGYKFQFVTLAGFHSLNHSMFELARGYRGRGMAAYSELQQAEFASEAAGYTATRHQREVGTGYFDLVAQTVAGGEASTVALAESTEAEQFITAVAAE
jgi:isocitrate lyase